jgi:predicted alpha/beta superfamily hydrolase
VYRRAVSPRPAWRDYPGRPGWPGHTVTGTVKVRPAQYSPQLHNLRDIYVCLPPTYDARPAARFPVVYMPDGQNLFDRVASDTGREWRVDETIEALSGEGLEAIVVGIQSVGRFRYVEHNPFPSLWNARGDHYLAFVVETLKPIIDRDFRTLPGRQHAGIVGSSFGAVIGLYAFFRRPDTFGFAGVMSPPARLVGEELAAYVRRASLVAGKLYLDEGTAELGSDVAPIYAALRDKGYRPGRDAIYVREEGGRYGEDAWARRLPDALRFLLR